MRTLAPIRHAALAVLAGVVACSPFEGEDGSSANGGGGESVDGGRPPGTDGGASTGDASASDVCAAHGGATVCDSFERGGDIAPAWSSRAVDTKGSTLKVAGGRVRSGVGALVTQLPSPCSESYAQLVHEAQGAPAQMQIRAEVAIVSAPTTTNVHLFGTQVSGRTGSYRVDLAISVDRLVLSENAAGSYTPHPATGKHPIGRYAHVELTISFSTPPRAVVVVDGISQIDTGLALPELVLDPRFELGNYALANCDKPTETWFDDVVYTLTKR